VAHATTPFVTIYNRSGDTFTKITSGTGANGMNTLPTGAGQQAKYNPDGTSLAVAHTTTPFVSIYNRSGDTYTKLTGGTGANGMNTLPTGNATSVAWNPAGTSLAVGHATTPFVSIYNRSGDTFTKITNPTVLPTGTVNSIKWSPDGNTLYVSHSNSNNNSLPPATIYTRSGDTFTSITTTPQILMGQIGGSGFDFYEES
jgi:WD40 repeat protein